jgi:hypothetical protein
MPLPKIDMPLFEMELPSTKKKIRFRQFTVKEEKILLVAQESDNIKDAIEAVKQVVNNCLIDEDIEQFAMFDLEYILLLLRSKSVNNNVRFAIKDPDTNESVELELDLDAVKVTTLEEHTNRIQVNDTYTIFLKYPTINQFLSFVDGDMNDPLVTYNVMTSCLDKLVSEDEVYRFSDFSAEEIDQFMGDLSSEVLVQIKQFFDTMPRLRHEMKYKNSNGDERTFVLEGMQSFFI